MCDLKQEDFYIPYFWIVSAWKPCNANAMLAPIRKNGDLFHVLFGNLRRTNAFESTAVNGYHVGGVLSKWQKEAMQSTGGHLAWLDTQLP